MFDSLKITTSYLSFYCFLVFQTVLKNVKNFRESYVFHCLVIKVICLATACLLYHIRFALSRTFLSFFRSFSNFFFNFIQPNLCCLSKKIRLTQKRIYHIIIFFLRQVLFYIFLHIFYAISDIAIISSFLTPQYQSKDLKIVRICAGRHSDPIPTVHRYQTFLIEDTHKYPD